jgi:PAS domain S-box-containing protein
MEESTYHNSSQNSHPQFANQQIENSCRTVLDGIRDHAIIRTDMSGNIIDWNFGAENIFGWTKEEVLEKNCSIIFTPEDIANHVSEKEMDISSIKGKAEDMRWHVRKDGTRFFANGIMNPLVDNEGSIFGFIKVLRDDTARTEIEEDKINAQNIADIAQKTAATTLKQFYDFFIQSPTPMVIIEGPDYLIKLANHPYENLVKRKVTGKKVLEAFTKEEVKDFIPRLDNVYKTGKPTIGKELPFIITDEKGEKKEHWLNFSYFPHFDEYGKIKGILADVHDVSDQVIARKKIQESESKFRQIANKLPNIVWTATPEGEIDWQSDKYYEYTGLSPMTKFDSKNTPLHPDDVATTAQKWNAAITSGEFFETEHRIKRKSTGDYRWNLAKALPVKDEFGNIIRWVGSTTEIDDLKSAQETLKRSESQFRTLANSLPLIIWTANPDGFVDWYNDWWYKYLGMPRDTKWDDPETSPMHPDDVKKTIPIWNESITTGKEYNIEQRFKRGSDGQYRTHLVRGSPIKNEHGEIIKWVGANTDIQDHKEFVDKLQNERVLRERFVAALSHDLRTPITSVKLSAQTLRRSSSDEKVLRTSDRMVANLDRLDSMIQDLLDANRLSAGEELPLHQELCDLSDIVHITLEELRHIHGNYFEIIEDRPHVKGNWDPDALRRIIENLCNNAIKYGDKDLPITIHYGCISKEMAFLSVHNYGKPITEDEIKLLFKPYSRTADAQASGKRGWGIGLMLVKGLVDAHDGSINVTSSKENGTTFKLKLPLKKL